MFINQSPKLDESKSYGVKFEIPKNYATFCNSKVSSAFYDHRNETEQPVMMMIATITATVPEFLSPKLKSTSRYFNSHGNKLGVSVSQFDRRRFLNPSRVFAVSDINKLVTEFDPEIPLEIATTPPSSWYTDTQFYHFELDRVFYGGWQAVG